MPTLKELARLGKQALLAFVALLLTELTALKARVEELLAENAALRAQLGQHERNSQRQAAPFSKGRRKAQPKRPGRRPGQGRFTFRTLPRPDQWTAPPIEIRLPDPVCPCCGKALQEHRVDFAAVTDIPPKPKPIVQPYRVWVYRCPTCDPTVRAPHPDLARDQFGATAHRMGPRVRAATHATHYGLGVPVRKGPAILRLSTSTVWDRLTGRKSYLYQYFPERVSPRWKESDDGAPVPTTQGSIARRLPSHTRHLPRCRPPPGGLRPTLRRHPPQPRESAGHRHLPRRTPLRPRAQERRGHRLPLRPRPTDAPGLRRRLTVGPHATDRRVEPPGGRRPGSPRRRAGLRPFGLPQEGERLRRCAAAVVRPARQGRELSGRRLPGLRHRLGARPGRFPALPPQGVDQGSQAAEAVWGPQGDPLLHAARTGVGDARLAWPGAAARLGQRRRRDGPSRVVPQEVGRSGRALLVGRAVEHDDPRPGGRAAAVRGPGPPPQAAVPGGARLGRVAAGGGVDPPDGPRRGEGPPGRGDRGAARGVEGGAEGGGVRGDAGGGTVRGGGQVEV